MSPHKPSNIWFFLKSSKISYSWAQESQESSQESSWITVTRTHWPIGGPIGHLFVDPSHKEGDANGGIVQVLVKGGHA